MSGVPAVRLDRIADTECESTQRGEHLGARENVGRASLRENLLRRRDVQDVANALVARPRDTYSMIGASLGCGR
jgi:hypothetical protein